MIVATPLYAGSIWARATRSHQVIYSDDTARSVGDTLTIIIKESSSATTSAERSNAKTTSRKAQTSGSVEWGNALDFLPNVELPEIDIDGSYEGKFDGSGEWTDSRKVEDKVTVIVEDVMPNGNLVVLGQTRRNISGNEEIVQISGIVRPSDIAFENTVNSERVADFYLLRRIKGPERNYTRPGWLNRFLDWASPA
jgi:flagellar L-ring protein precursor FlgH